MIKFTIDRSKWDRGNSGGYLLGSRNGNVAMCCLGFCAKALGFTDDEIYKIPTPWTLRGKINPTGECYLPSDQSLPVSVMERMSKWGALAPAQLDNSDLTRRLILANDTAGYSEEKRELEIKELFLEAGFEVEFVGEGNPASLKIEDAP